MYYVLSYDTNHNNSIEIDEIEEGKVVEAQEFGVTIFVDPEGRIYERYLKAHKNFEKEMEEIEREALSKILP